jgi:hypothetical protein
MQLRFGGNWLHIIFRWVVLEAAQIWRELAQQYFPADCFGGGSDLAGTGSTLFSGRLFWRQLRFGGNHNKKTDTTAQLYCTLSTYVTPKTISRQNQKN